MFPLRRITVLAQAFQGYQQARGYRMRATEDEPGEPVTRMAPRSLMVPPGIPEFLSRRRIVDAGVSVLRGRAWTGLGAIERVEVSDDDGASRERAVLDEPTGPFAWGGWSYEWGAPPGDHIVCSRATDATGATQPLAPAWNVGGYRQLVPTDPRRRSLMAH